VRSGTDGYEIQDKTKGDDITRRTKVGRHVPVAEPLREIVLRFKSGKEPDDLLFTAPKGGRLNKNNWKVAVHWVEHRKGRRIHDLRHTAATLWLSCGIRPKTVQGWLGHASMTVTLDTYAHFMSDDADLIALARLNKALSDAAGTRSVTESENGTEDGGKAA
jgi:integrase